jgi:hypothetical protein
MAENWRIHWKDYYRILQVDPSAEPEVIKAAYDKLARKYHPDINKDRAAGSRMSDINEAYEILKDLARRKLYHAEWLQKTNSRGLPGKHHRGFNYLRLLLICAIVGGIVIIAVNQKKEPLAVSPTNIETNTVTLPVNVKIKSVILPVDARMSSGDIVYEQFFTVTNLEPSDVRVYWEGTSSLTGKFDSGYVSISKNDSREIKRSYSYSVIGVEEVTYTLYYGHVILDTFSATHEISQ